MTVLDDAHRVELEYAEPSPTMEFLSRVWRRIVFLFKTAFALAIIGTYPALTFAAHKIDDTKIEFANGYEWSVGEVGGTVTLIARILEGPGWASDSPEWHPRARLTAMPAWQEGIASASSDYMRLIATQTKDDDVAAAARLLAPEPVGMPDRLTAAAEILARYDSSVENGHAEAATGEKALAERLRLASGWAVEHRASLASAVQNTNTWPASFDDISMFYKAKAHAHVAHELLDAALAQDEGAVTARNLTAQKNVALSLWRQAASQRPLLVANQSGSDAILGNNLMSMAFLLDEANTATLALAEAIEQPFSKPEPARSAELAASAPPSP